MPNHDEHLDTLFQALADPTRRAVIERLTAGPAAVKELAEPFDMALPSFMQHLRMLEDSGLISSRKEGRKRICAIQPMQLSVAEEWVARLRAQWEARFDRLDAYLQQLEGPGKEDAQ